VNDAGVEASGGEGTLDEAMVTAGAFDDDEEITEVVVADGLAELLDGVVEGGPVMVKALGRKEHGTEEVSKHPLRIGFVAIEAGDAEVGGSGLFDAVVEVAAGLVQGGVAVGRGLSASAMGGHGKDLREGGEGHP
jgi:hypothetical protein